MYFLVERMKYVWWKKTKDQGFESSIYITYFTKNHLNPSHRYSIKIYFIYETFYKG